MNAMTQEEMQEVLNNIMLCITEKMTGVQLKCEENICINDCCTVNVVFEGNCDVKLSLCADKLFFIRITKSILQDDNITEQDMQDTAKEYLNVIYGNLIGKLFNAAYKPTCFKSPIFKDGNHIIDNSENVQHICQTCYYNDYNENVMLVITMSLNCMDKENI